MKIRVMQPELLACGCPWKNAKPIGIDGELIQEVIAVDTERAELEIYAAGLYALPEPQRRLPSMDIRTVTAPFAIWCDRHGMLATT